MDILMDSVTDDAVVNIEESDNWDSESQGDTPDGDMPEEGYEVRITEFPASQDAHMQSGRGYNQQIIRLAKNSRTSYLLFDLSAIDSIGAYITEATLQFVVSADEGDGTIDVFKGFSSDWTETNLAESTAPEIDVIVGSVNREYLIGASEEIELSTADIEGKATTLILEQKEGNDLAIASKEHPSKKGPKLIVRYNAPVGAKEIIPPGQNSSGEDSNEETTNEEPPADESTAPENAAPLAVADATPTSGAVPLEVTFTGGNSTDDTSVTRYMWDFKDGNTATVANPTHTFDSSGTYVVELTVEDEGGLTGKDTVTITVEAPTNEAPNSVATANPLTGDAPLTVNFTGSNSIDDNGITAYYWNFPDDPSSAPNATRTFNEPGVYDISLTVTDGAGLQDTANLTITVTQPDGGSTGSGDCITNGGRAGDTGLKTWCWNDIYFPSYTGSTGISFSEGQLSYTTECDEQSVTKVGDRIKFHLNPTTPETPGGWCSKQYNMRAEFSTMPWPIQHSLGTEEWFGFTYTFGDDYKADVNEWLFHQVHNGISGQTPLYELMVARTGLYGAQAGEIVVKNNANSPDHVLTGVIPQAGQTIKVVIHVIWDNATNGLLQVWIDDNIVYNKQVTTIRPGWNFGGNAKWGIYKWPWVDGQNVQNSANAGVTSLTTYMGALRIITRKPGDANYGNNSYALVSPQ